MSASSSPRRVRIIGCGVLAADLKHAALQLGMDARLRFLPGGLHSEPNRLREALQAAIDAVSDEGDADVIMLGYGLCGRGTVDLRARDIPLVIPRVHDCIALFLGSDARYREQFARAPGSYYLSAGWVEEQGDGGPAIRMGSDGPSDPEHDAYARLLRQYGEENADYVTAFMGSWKRNYTRSVFIDTGVGTGKARYEAAARRLAETCGWRYERLEGTHDLIVKLLTAEATTDEVLVVPPGQSTVYDAVRRRLDAAAPAGPVDDAPVAGGVAPGVEPGPGDGVTLCSGIGLGIDAGGTYTDAVLYDFETRAVLASSKAPTTPRDPSLGVAEALRSLRHARLREARLVCISTTLATNALVEQRGQPVGLLLMPPYGNRDVSAFRHTPLACIDGQLDIDGRELQPVEPAQVAATARRLVEQHGVAAFAVGGFAGHINPAHELAVKRAVIAATGLGVTCGHDLSDRLDYRVRAETAALNARIIPCLQALLERLQPVLSAHGVAGTVMVVRSDGSLMSLKAAMDRPLETMLSGPAASVAGAAWLAREPDALVVDVGGTTTDAAIVRNGQVRMLDSGATIGTWQTHIRALDLHTRGLGGDSEVRMDKAGLHLGPRRVLPAAWLGTRQPALAEAIAWLRDHTRDSMPDPESLILIACDAATPADAERATDEREILDLLRERPRSLLELRLRLDRLHTDFVPLAGLEACGAVFRCGLTPTDALHVTGQMELWDRPAALALCALYGSLAGASGDVFARRIIDTFEIRLATEILCRQLGETMAINTLERQPAALTLIRRGLGDAGGDPACRIRFALDIPIIGIGAPAACFVPAAAARLNARCIVPEHAGVANAIGAVTGAISLHRRVSIQPDDQGRFRITGMPDAPLFASIEEATAAGRAFLETELTALAQAAGAEAIRLAIHADDAAAPAADGSAVFISRILEGHVAGRPAI